MLTHLVEEGAEKEVFRTRLGASNVLNVLRREPTGQIETYNTGESVK